MWLKEAKSWKKSFTFIQLSPQKRDRMPSTIKCTDTCTIHSPWNNSGAAYGGLPQNVSNLLPGVNSLLNPKSAILIFISLSSSKFSACNTILKTWNTTFKCMTINMLNRFWLTNLTLWLYSRIKMKCKFTFKSRWIIFFWWQYCTAETIWKKSVISVLHI